jgi:hypothetical protein
MFWGENKEEKIIIRRFALLVEYLRRRHPEILNQWIKETTK